jgi:two-component system, LytTR family, response regulator
MIKVVIIENEETAILGLVKMLNNMTASIIVVGTYKTITDAANGISEHHPDIVFLDIELDSESGLDLIYKFPDPTFEIIFITAYDKYMLKAIRCSCLDYLLKPINDEELINAIEKFKKKKFVTSQKLQLENLRNTVQSTESYHRVCIFTLDSIIFIKKSEMCYCEADGNYTHIYITSGEKFISSKNIGYMATLFDDVQFFRCHKSYLVNLNHVRRMNTKDGLKLFMECGGQATVSNKKKDELLSRFKY